MTGQHDAFVAWAAGRTDAMGAPWSSWLLARYQPDGRAMRDEHGRQVMEPQADYLARQGLTDQHQPARAGQLDLFA